MSFGGGTGRAAALTKDCAVEIASSKDESEVEDEDQDDDEDLDDI
jgi:hypothetical protein